MDRATLAAFWDRYVEGLRIRELVELQKRTRNALTRDGKVRGEEIAGTVAYAALPPIDASGVGLPDDAADDLQTFLDTLGLTYAPLGATYVVQTPHGTLTAEQALSALATGLLKVTTGTGVLSAAVANTDYLPVASPTATGTLTTANLTATGDSTLGNGDADVLIVQGHDRHKGAAPSIAVGAALGTGGSVNATIAGTDQAGTVTLTAGTTSLTTGVMATVTFATARPSTAYALALDPTSATAGIDVVQVFALKGTSLFTIRCNVAPTSGLVLTYDYLIREYAN